MSTAATSATMEGNAPLPRPDAEEMDAGMITSIAPKTVNLIVAGQAVTDLSSAVKELVDNALDSGARCINIRLWNQGLDVLEVSDDGCGVPIPSRPLMAAKHATSKIRSFEDVYQDSMTPTVREVDGDIGIRPGSKQLGFRGEALFCLANLSKNLAVSTRTPADALGQKFQFRHDGSLDENSVEDCPRKVGTTVAVEKLFDAFPVRRADMTKRIKSQRNKLIKMMQGYAILCLGVRFNLIDITGPVGSSSCRSEVKMSTAVSSRIEQTISSVLGTRFLGGLTRICVDLSSAVERTDETTVGDTNEATVGEDEHGDGVSSAAMDTADPAWKIEGLVSKPRSATTNGSFAARELQFFSINGRPVELPKLSRTLGDAWREFESTSGHHGANSNSAGKRRPAAVLSLTLPNHTYDVNLSPDKREVLLTDETAICRALREALTVLWSSQAGGTFVSNEVEEMSNQPASRGAPTERLNWSNGSSNDQVQPPVANRKMKRRNAFVHDFGNMRVHDEDELQPLPSSAELRGAIAGPVADRSISVGTIADQADCAPSPAPPTESSLGTPSQVNSCAGVDQARKKPVDDSENSLTKGGATGTGANGTIDRGSPQPADKERRDWMQMQQQFNRATGADCSQEKEIRIICSNARGDNDIAGDVNSAMAEDEFVDAAPQLDRASHSRRKKGGSEYQNTRMSSLPPKKRNKRVVEGKVASLDQFAFQPQDRSSASEDGLSVDGSSIQRSGCASGSNKANAAQGSSGAMRDDIEDCWGSSKRKRGAPSDGNQKSEDSCQIGKLSGADGDETIRPPSSACDSPNEIDEGQRGGDTGERNPKIAKRVTSKDRPPSAYAAVKAHRITWSSFTGTNGVVRSSRAARLRTRANRRALQNARSSKRQCNNPWSEGSKNGVDESVGAAGGVLGKTNASDKLVNLNKEDFIQMSIIGQFNLGFILARCKNQHLWILDQHACDEKFNFEGLCKNTVIHEQKLIAPLPLELSPSEENCVLENMDVFKKNGFQFAFDSTKPPRHRLALTALPHSGARDGRKAVQFGKDDVGALCAMLGADGANSVAGYGAGCGTGTDGGGSSGNNAVRRYAGGDITLTSDSADGTEEKKLASKGGITGSTIVRLPKAIAMFANRACRSSIMIGKSLSLKEMTAVVTKMHKVDQPWDCPHGRPTMRHVRDLLDCLVGDEHVAAEHVAGPSLAVLSQDEEDPSESTMGQGDEPAG